jgi:Trypsin-like peptidase domain
MPLTLEMMYCAARIIGDIDRVDAEGGVVGRVRGVIGTGFCLRVQGDACRYGYLLTAAHVLDGQENVEVQFADPGAEGDLQPPIKFTDWRYPIDGLDLAVSPLFTNPDVRDAWVMILDMEPNLVPSERVPTLHLGSRIFYIGLLDPLGRPMARSGTIGALHQTGLEHEGGYVYKAHLIDCRSYEGFSGSPCFAELRFTALSGVEPPIELPKEARDVEVGPTFSLAVPCGMFTEHVDENNADGAVSRYGVGVMLRGEEIREALMSDELVAERRRKDAELAALAKDDAESGPRLRNAGKRSAPADEWDRFEDLTRKLVQVPKPEKPL